MMTLERWHQIYLSSREWEDIWYMRGYHVGAEFANEKYSHPLSFSGKHDKWLPNWEMGVADGKGDHEEADC